MNGCDESYEPRLPSNEVLIQLPLAKFKEIINRSTNCTHNLFRKTDSFVEFIYWILHISSFDHVDHFNHCVRLAIILFNSTNSICAHCKTVFLSTVPFDQLMTSIYYCQHSEDVSLPVKWLNLKFMNELFFHPKIYKIMSLNMSIFEMTCHMICTYLHDDLVKTVKYNYPKQEKICVLLRMTFLSIKYWKKDHLLHFINFYYTDFQYYGRQFLVKSTNQAGINAKRIQNHHVLRSIFGDVTHLLFKSKNKDLLNQIKDKQADHAKTPLISRLKGHNAYINNTLRYLVKNETKILFYGNVIKCAYEKCNKEQGKDEKYKICKGCKMTYYCGKKCQKKSWNKRHRMDCKQLSKYYNL
eukprot:428690_1